MINDLIKNAEVGQVIIFENKEFDMFRDQVNYIFYFKRVTDDFIPKL